MNAVLAALAGVLVVAGLLGVIVSLRPAPEPPPKPVRRPGRVATFWRTLPAKRRVAALVALAAGLVTGLLTGWLVLAVLLPGAVLGLPLLLATSPETQRIARLDGIAEWTRNLSGVLTAGQGLEQALIAEPAIHPASCAPGGVGAGGPAQGTLAHRGRATGLRCRRR